MSIRIKITLLWFALSGIFLLGGFYQTEHRPLYFTPPNIIRHFALGYHEWIADLLWIRFLQDSDFCSMAQGVPVYNGNFKQCDLGWSYRLADAITELAPRFKSVYKVSSVLMSIFVGDQKGAERILRKGLAEFPKDWQMNFYATYFYSVEVPQPHRAVYYAHRAANNGGPSWLQHYTFTNHQQPGSSLFIKKTILQQLLERNPIPRQKDKLLWHLRNLPTDHL